MASGPFNKGIGAVFVKVATGVWEVAVGCFGFLFVAFVERLQDLGWSVNTMLVLIHPNEGMWWLVPAGQ